MSKYDPLWKYISDNDIRELTFDEVERICGFPIDHSFLTFKKELKEYGYAIGKISLKEQRVKVDKLPEE